MIPPGLINGFLILIQTELLKRMNDQLMESQRKIIESLTDHAAETKQEKGMSLTL